MLDFGNNLGLPTAKRTLLLLRHLVVATRSLRSDGSIAENLQRS